MAFKEFNIINVRLRSESINFSMMDDTGMNEYPLLNLCINKIDVKAEMESGADDPAAFILKKMGIAEHPQLSVEAGLHLESQYYNIEAGSYEPLIEPWMVNASALQKTASTEMVADVRSDQLLNLNMTYGMALVLRKIQDRMDLDEDEWEDEVKLTKNKTLQSKWTADNLDTYNIQTSKRSEIKCIREEETSGFHYQNYLGLRTTLTLENFDRTKKQVDITDEQEEIAEVHLEEFTADLSNPFDF